MKKTSKILKNLDKTVKNVEKQAKNRQKYQNIIKNVKKSRKKP